MATFLTLAFSFPTAVFTTLLLVMAGYWLLVLVGAFGFDLHADSALDAKGAALDAKAAMLEAKAGALEGKLEAVEAKAGLLAALGFGVVPATISLTVIIFWAWLLSMLGSATLGPALGGWLPLWGSSLLVGLVALFAALLVSMVSVKPLRPIFTMTVAPTRRQLLGKVATVSSGRVDGKFGQAVLEDGGAGLILPIFCPRENALKKGDRVLLLELDEKAEAYEVEPVDWLLPEELQQLADPLAAESVARAHLKQRLG